MTHPRQITRVGVYGVVIENGEMLVVRQQRGPFAGKFDFPGGGIEFGETVEEALRREFIEEVVMKFDTMQFIDNLTATVEVPSTLTKEPYSFYQIGMIYKVDRCQVVNDQICGDLEHLWINLKNLSEKDCSKLLWKYRALALSTEECLANELQN